MPTHEDHAMTPCGDLSSSDVHLTAHGGTVAHGTTEKADSSASSCRVNLSTLLESLGYQRGVAAGGFQPWHREDTGQGSPAFVTDLSGAAVRFTVACGWAIVLDGSGEPIAAFPDLSDVAELTTCVRVSGGCIYGVPVATIQCAYDGEPMEHVVGLAPFPCVDCGDVYDDCRRCGGSGEVDLRDEPPEFVRDHINAIAARSALRGTAFAAV